MILGSAFLVNKYFEWGAKIHHGIYPGSPELLERPQGEILFFGLYFVMTGLHGLHVLVGLVLLSVMAVWVARGKASPGPLTWHSRTRGSTGTWWTSSGSSCYPSST